MNLENAVNCGYLREHTPPLLFAENSCLRALQGAHQRAMQRTGDNKPSGMGRIIQARAWSFWELGMATQSTDEAQTYFEAASNGADAVLLDDTLDSSTRLDAALFKVHLPAFRKRQEGAAVTAQDIQYIRECLASTYMLGKTLLTGANTQNAGDHRVKQDLITVMMAAARTGTIIYPGSPRESQTEHFTPTPPSGEERMHGSVKHDGYVALDGVRKLPIKIRSASRTKYSPQVLRLSPSRLVDSTFSHLRYNPVRGNAERFAQLREAGYTPAYLHNAISGLLVSEIQQPDTLGPTECYLLNGLSDTLQSLLVNQQRMTSVANHG